MKVVFGTSDGVWQLDNGAPEPSGLAGKTISHVANDSGTIYVTHTRLRGVYAIRFVVGQTATERRHVQEAWEVVREVARGLKR